MSVRVMSMVWEASPSKGAARLVLLALADAAADTGEVGGRLVSQEMLAWRCRLSRRAVQRALDRLEAEGELRRIVHGDGRTPSRYQLCVGGAAR